MIDLINNPIYNYVIKDSKGPSERVCLLIGAMIALTAIVPAVLSASQTGPQDLNVVTALLLAPLVLMGWLTFIAPLVPVVATVLTANRIARLAGQEDFALVRISGITAEDIAWGYIEGQRHRFRLWIAIGSGVVASQLVGPIMTYIQGYNGSSVQTLDYYSSLAILAAWIITFTAYPFMLWPLCITAGVWAALSDPKHGSWWAAGVALCLLVYLALVVASLLGILVSYWWGRHLLLACAGFEIAVAFGIPWAALTALRRDCVRLIERDSTKEVVN